MEQTLELTAQELVERFPKIANRNTALRAVAQSVLERLGENYHNLEMQEKMGGDFLIDCLGGDSSYVKGYSIQEKTPLQTPEIKKSLFGLLKHTRTHDARELCYLASRYVDSASESELLVRVNEKPVIEACEEVAERTGRNVSVRYTF